MLKLSQYRAVTLPLHDSKAGTVNRVLLSTRTEQIRVLDEQTWQRLVAGSIAELPDTILMDLIRAELVVPEDEDELQTVLARNAAAASDYKVAYLVVQPTAACQFGCGYCGQTHRPQFLSEEHQAKVVGQARALLATGRYTTLQVGWFGGEATLAMKQVRALTREFQAVASEYGCRYDAKLVSNGLLLGRDLVTELVNELGVSMIEITLDGSRDYHDQSRPTKGGQPTFTTVFQNTLAIARRDDLHVHLSIRCNVSRANREGVLELLDLLAREGVQRRLTIYAAPIHDWGNNAREEFGSTTEEFAAWEVDFFIRAIERGFRPTLLPGRKAVNCMVFMPGAEMIDAYGNRFNCTEVSYVGAYEAPAEEGGRFSLPILGTASGGNRYAIGHLDSEGEIPGRRQIFGDFYQRVERGEYPCHSCAMLPVCGGMCPKSWAEGAPACPPAKFNIAERLMIRYAMERGAFDGTSAAAA